jgi:peptidoglycan/LPS O-acetylase OafA/YrhL
MLKLTIANQHDFTKMNYRREIDGLRALAVLPVLFFHAGFQIFSGGFVGVDVFFVISGYLITTLILADLEKGTFSIIHFYERRARRILPALFFVMFVCLPFAWMWLLPHELRSFSQSLVAVSLFASNILFWLTSGYFETAAELKPLLHTWSLAVEEQYYVFFPLFLMAAWRFGERFFLALLVAVFVLSLAAAEWGSVANPTATFFLLPTRGWELLVGAFVAIYFSRKQGVAPSKRLCELGASVGLTLLVYSVFSFDSQTPFPSLYALIPTIGSALIILFASNNTFVGRLLGSKVFVGVGLISYSAYLWHQPMLAFARHRQTEEMGPAFALAIVLSALLMAYFSWRFVEAPFRNKMTFSRAQIFKMGVAGTVFFIGVGAAGHLSGGFSGRFNFVDAYEGDIGQETFFKFLAKKHFDCTPEAIAEEAIRWEEFLRCKQSKSTVDVEVALIGDSHIEHIFLGLADHLPNKNIVYYQRGSYPFLSNPVFGKIFTHVLRSDSINTVLLTAHWVQRADEMPRDTTLEQELLQTINALVSAGKKVYLLSSVPEFPFPPERCKFLVEGFDKTICDTSKSDIVEQEQQYIDSMKNVSSQIPGVHFLRISDLLCGEATCSMVKNGVLMYRDYQHLNILGSMYVGAEIVKNFPELKR